jgi:hypothetical protein
VNDPEQRAALMSEGIALTDKINEKLHALLTEDLPQLDSVRERMGRGSEEARVLIHRVIKFPGMTVVEAGLRVLGWQRRSTVQIVLHNQFPPGVRR